MISWANSVINFNSFSFDLECFEWMISSLENKWTSTQRKGVKNPKIKVSNSQKTELVNFQNQLLISKMTKIEFSITIFKWEKSKNLTNFWNIITYWHQMVNQIPEIPLLQNPQIRNFKFVKSNF